MKFTPLTLLALAAVTLADVDIGMLNLLYEKSVLPKIKDYSRYNS